MDSYVSQEPLTGFDREDLSITEAVEELVLMGLRYKGGLDLGRLEMMVGKHVGRGLFDDMEGFRIIRDYLVPDDKGLMVADAAASSILDALY